MKAIPILIKVLLQLHNSIVGSLYLYSKKTFHFLKLRVNQIKYRFQT